jgi:hypothetical protein
MKDSSNKIELIIRPKGRTPADEYYHKGKIFIEGRENSNYTIELRNLTGHRLNAVVSVDGLAVTDGKPASYDSHGYLIDPYQTIAIPGWMISDQQAAEFVFSKRGNSYGNQMGYEDNAGVIGVAVFEEESLKPYTIPNYLSGNPMGYPQPIYGSGANQHRSSTKSINIVASSYSVVEPTMGTGFGDAVDFKTTPVDFKKASENPSCVLLAYYDSASNLQKMGIKLKDRNLTSGYQKAFPASSPTYCEPPPSWVVNSR